MAALLLTACAQETHLARPAQAVQSLDAETADLADVTNDALELAQRVGKDRILVVFDIDNTLLAMEQGLGSDQWYDWQKSLAKNDPCDPQYVGDRFAVQGAIYFASAMRPTQPDAAGQVKRVQDFGIKVISVTSRGMDYRLQTFRELRRNGISFSFSAIGPAGGYAEPFLPVEGGRLSRYEDGVFLTAGQHKGEMLKSLLDKTGAGIPAVIVMTDDKQGNLDTMKETFSVLGVPVRAWRYTAEDGNVTTFDPEQADAQWQTIESPLREIQQVFGPDNYNLTNAVPPSECNASSSGPNGD